MKWKTKKRYQWYVRNGNEFEKWTDPFDKKIDAYKWYLKWGAYWQGKGYELKLFSHLVWSAVYKGPVKKEMNLVIYQSN